MRPQCIVGELRIEGPGRREVVARFDGGRMSSDGGAVPLRDADRIVGVTAELATVVQRIRAHRPDTAIMVRADSGFCREELMSRCESHDVDFVPGVAKSSRLRARIARSCGCAF